MEKNQLERDEYYQQSHETFDKNNGLNHTTDYCEICQPHLEPIFLGSSLKINACKCMDQSGCTCPECHCFTCKKLKGSISTTKHSRHESFDWKDLEKNADMDRFQKHSKLCACRGSGMGCLCLNKCICATMEK